MGESYAQVESIDLPPGYSIEWGGEFEDSNNAQASLISGMVPALIIVALLVVAPLLQDVFWVAMAVTIMFGLASFVSRGLRFFIIAFLLWKFGEKARLFIEKNFGKVALAGFAVAVAMLIFLSLKS